MSYYVQQAADVTSSFISTFVDKGVSFVDVVVDKVAQITEAYSKNFDSQDVASSETTGTQVSMPEDQLSFLLQARKKDPRLFGRLVDVAAEFKVSQDKEKLIDDFLLVNFSIV